MRVLGAHSSSPSHTLKRTVRRPAKSPPSLAILSASGTGRCRTPAPPDEVQLLQAFRPSLDRSRLAEVTRLTDSRKARTGLRRAGLFYSQLGPAAFASAVRATLPPSKATSQFDFARTRAGCGGPTTGVVASRGPLRSEPTSLWLVLNIIQRPGPEGHPNHQKLDPRFLCGVCMIRLTAACI